MDNLTVDNIYLSEEEKNKAQKLLDSYTIEDVYAIVESGNIMTYFSFFNGELYKIFQDAGYNPTSLDDANNYLNCNIFELDKQKEILGVYVDEKTKSEKSIVINSNNFFTGYFLPIWKNLEVAERAQIVKWHLDFRTKELNVTRKINLRFVEQQDNLWFGNGFGSISNDSNVTMYINYNLINYTPVFDLISTIEHELEHLKQANLYGYLIKQKKQKNNLFEKCILLNNSQINIPANLNVSKNIKNAIYIGYKMERDAEDVSYKKTLQIYNANIAEFGLSNLDKKAFKDFVLFYKNRNYLLTPNEFQKYNNATKKEVEQYIKDKKFIKKADLLLKLELEKTILRKRLLNLTNEEQFDEKYQQAKNKLIKVDEKFASVIKNEKSVKIKKDFFDELNLE